MRVIKGLCVLALALLALPFLSACGSRPVTLYTDGDRDAVQKLVEPYTKRTGRQVEIVHFTDPRELVDAIAHREGGKAVVTTHDSMYDYADVVLSTEKDTGEALLALDALRQFDPAESEAIPSGAKHEGRWYGLGGRAWVLLWNTTIAGAEPSELLDLAKNDYPEGSVALINPNYILYYPCGAASILGAEKMRGLLQRLVDRKAQWLATPAQTAQLVADGKAAVCLTTLAQARLQQENGAPVRWALPDQGSGGMGAYVELNVVALPTTSQSPGAALALAEYLLEPDTEKLSVQLGLADVALRPQEGLLSATPLKTDLRAAEDGMLAIGTMLTWFTDANPRYHGQ